MNMELFVWIIIAIISIVVEMATTALVSIWFCLGSIAAVIVKIIGGAFWIQAVAFIIVSIITGIALYPVLTKTIRKGPNLKSNIDNYIGKVAKVDEVIDNISGTGRVTYNGISWAARSLDDSVKITCEHVKIIKVEGAKLIVEPYKTVEVHLEKEV